MWRTICAIKVTCWFTLLFWISFVGNLCLVLLWTRIWFYLCQLSSLGIWLSYQNYCKYIFEQQTDCQEILFVREVLLVLRNVKERNKQYFKFFLFFTEVPNVKYSDRMVFIKYRQNILEKTCKGVYFLVKLQTRCLQLC